MSYYALEAAQKLNECILELKQTMHDEDNLNGGANSCLYDLQVSLFETERLLLLHLHQMWTKARKTSGIQSPGIPTGSLASYNELLRDSDGRHLISTSGSERSAVESLLFRLTVALQLCLVRIGDARFAIVGSRRSPASYSSTNALDGVLAGSLLAIGVTSGLLWRQRVSGAGFAFRVDHQRVMVALLNVIVAGTTLSVARTRWNIVWMTRKVVDTTRALDEWNQQWSLVQEVENEAVCVLEEEKKTLRLIEHTMRATPKVRPVRFVACIVLLRLPHISHYSGTRRESFGS